MISAKNIRVSNHAKGRIAERVPQGVIKNPVKLFKTALKDGYNPNQLDSEFMYYLKGKTKNWKFNAKIYEDNIYVHNNGVLITVLEVPEEYLPVENHLIPVIKNKKEDFNMDLKEIVKNRPNVIRKHGPKQDEATMEYDEKLFNLGYKECRSCLSVKKLDQFSPRSQSKDGRGPYCNTCVRNKARKSKDEKISTSAKEVSTSIEDTIKTENIKPKLTYNIETVIQATSFSDYLNKHNISDEEFIKYIDIPENIMNAVEVYKHMALESRELYLKLKGDK